MADTRQLYRMKISHSVHLLHNSGAALDPVILFSGKLLKALSPYFEEKN